MKPTTRTDAELRSVTLPTADEELRATARRMAYAMGISVWVRDGRIHQTGPGEEIAPPSGAVPIPNSSISGDAE